MERRATGSCAPGAGCGRRGEGHGPRAADRASGQATRPAPCHHLEAWNPSEASPVYGTDLVTLTVAIVLAAAIMLLAFHLVPDLADPMPPALGGAR